MAKRAMSSEVASAKKRGGHEWEKVFAAKIGGEVSRGSIRGKKDIVGPNHETYSVKGGKYSQVFLYKRQKIVENTIFQALGNTASILIACIDAFPPHYHQYLQDKMATKRRLQVPMRMLKDELSQPRILRAFFSRAFFNGNEVDYLAIRDIPTDRFCVFGQKDVVDIMTDHFSVENSKAQRRGEVDDLKVLFKYRRLNVGEFEMRNDSIKHYREVKFRLNNPRALEMLCDYCQPNIVH